MTPGADLAAPAGGRASELEQPRRLVAVAAVLSSMALVVLDASIVHVALPTIADALQVTPARAVLVVTAYQAALVMALLPLAALGERLGYRRVFVAGVAVFTAASVLCALSTSLPWLLAARFLQGLGGAAVMALGVALLRFSVPPGRLGSAIGWNALTVALASAAGPSIGAWILSAATWPWLFAINLPIGAVALLASRALPVVRGRATAFDLMSAALNALMFGALIVGAELVVDAPGWAAALVVTAAVAGVALTRREAAKSRPLVPLDLLRQPSFRASMIASVCCFAGQTAGLVALPFFLQHAMGKSALATGLIMTAWPLSVAATAPIAGRLADRFPTGLLCAAGGATLAAGLMTVAVLPPQADLPLLLFGVILCGAGFGLFQTPNNRNMFLSAPAERAGAAGGAQGTARLTGQTAGAVLVTLLLGTGSVDGALRVTFSVGAALACAAAVVSVARASKPAPRAQ